MRGLKLRRSHVCFNDGDMRRLLVTSDEQRRTLVFQREEARVLTNLGKEPCSFPLLKGEELKLISRERVEVKNGCLELPPMTLAVLMTSTEEVENREVEHGTSDRRCALMNGIGRKASLPVAS